MHPLSVSSIDISGETACESSWVDALGPAVEEFIPFGFA